MADIDKDIQEKYMDLKNKNRAILQDTDINFLTKNDVTLEMCENVLKNCYGFYIELNDFNNIIFGKDDENEEYAEMIVDIVDKLQNIKFKMDMVDDIIAKKKEKKLNDPKKIENKNTKTEDKTDNKKIVIPSKKTKVEKENNDVAEIVNDILEKPKTKPKKDIIVEDTTDTEVLNNEDLPVIEEKTFEVIEPNESIEPVVSTDNKDDSVKIDIIDNSSDYDMISEEDNDIVDNREVKEDIVPIIEEDNSASEENNSIDYNAVDPDKEIFSIRDISRKQTDKLLKKLTNLNMSPEEIKKVSMFDATKDESFRKEYLTTRNNMISAPRRARIGLLMSGHFEEISAYGNWDLSSIERMMTSDQYDFVDREIELYNSIYEHVLYVSYSKTIPDFEEWAKSIKYPDYKSLFFGVYDANTVGSNSYRLMCPFCDKEITAIKDNKELVVAIDKSFDKHKLKDFITSREVMSLDSSSMSKWAQTTVVRKQLTHSRYIIEYAVPSLFDYLETITKIRELSKTEISNIDISNVETFDDELTAARILIYMYIKRIGAPTPVGDNSLKFIGLTNKSDIIKIINSLDIDDYNQLFTGKEVQDLLSKKAIDYYMDDVKCENKDCGKVINKVAFEPKTTFFFKIGEVSRTLRMIL